MLDSEIPDGIDGQARQILRERYPNYCHDCGNPVILAGGWQRLQPGKGVWYDHIDAVLTCPEDCWRQTFMSGLDREEGLQHYVESDVDEERHSRLFGDVVGYCEHHGAMKVTKDIQGTVGPLRQFKCPECDRGMALLYDGD